MRAPEVVTVGWITIDDIVLPSGTYMQKVLGGGALYAAVGARIWTERVGLHSVAGEDGFEEAKRAIEGVGIDTKGVYTIPGPGLELWLLHETETDKQQVPKLAAATADEMDRGRGPVPDEYREAKAFHIAPQTPASAFGHLETLSSLETAPILTLDLLVDPYVDAGPMRDLGFLGSLEAFLPSREEVQRLWAPGELASWGQEQATARACHVVVKMGHRGSLACAYDGRVFLVPAYPSEVADTTGAGDAYCGGFAAGLARGLSVTECAAMGTVSASYVVEAWGALTTEIPSDRDRGERFEKVMEGITEHD